MGRLTVDVSSPFTIDRPQMLDFVFSLRSYFTGNTAWLTYKKCCLSLRAYLTDNATCLNYEDVLWRVIMNLRTSLYKASVIVVAFNTNCRSMKNFSKTPEYEIL